MIMQPTARISLLASALLLAACGSGGGSTGGLVRVDPPPTTPPQGASSPCAEPLEADCVVDASEFDPPLQMTNGRASSFALIKQGQGYLVLKSGDYQFDSGTHVQAGGLGVDQDARLVSDTRIDFNAGVSLAGTIVGNVVNEGTLSIGPTPCDPMPCYVPATAHVDGDYRQTADGMLVTIFGGTLQVSGRADLAGILDVEPPWDWDYGYVFPEVPSAQHVLHADGGVFGQFEAWQSDLFVDGSIRYEANDVWFDLVRLSLEAVMASSAAGDAMTLASARRLDAAFALADAFAGTPRDQLSLAQRRFLASAARIQHVASLSAAARSLASLSGRGQSLLETQLQGQGGALAARIATRLDTQPHQPGVQAWTTALDPSAGSAGDGIQGQLHGFSQWLGPRLLVGGSVATGEATLRLDGLDGQAWGPAPMSSVFARVGNDRWYGFGLLGAGRARLDMQRPIDIADGRPHMAWSRREVTLAQAHGEFGRALSVAGGRLVPYAAVDVSQLRDRGFAEQGDTGLELVAQPGQRAWVSGAVGTRYDRTWTIGASGWLRLDIDAQLRQQLGAYGDPLQAAFAGTPASLFPLDDPTQPATTGWLRLGLLGGRGDAWTWSLDQAWAPSGPVRNQWLLAVRRAL